MIRSLEFCVRFIFLLILIPGMTGAIRYYSGFALPIAFVCSVLFACAYFIGEYFLRRHVDTVQRPVEAFPASKFFSAFVFVSLVVLTAVILHKKFASPAFFNLPIVGTEGGGDAGNHVMLSETFKLKNPKEYEGQNLFYVLVSSIVDETKRDFHAAFWKATFHLWFASLSATLITFFAIAKKFHDWRALFASGVFGLIVTVALSDRMVFPYYHYLQIDGFFSSIAGVAVLLVIWSAYTILESPVARCFVVLTGVLVLRHAYALNVGEFLTAALCVCFWESANKKRFWQWILRASAFSLALGAAIVYWKLYPLLKIGGGFTLWKPHNAYPLIVLFVVASFLELKLSSGQEELRETAYVRFLKFALAFVLAGFVVQLLVYFSGIPLAYYYYKHAIPLFLFSSVGLIGILIRKLSLRVVGDVQFESSRWNQLVKILLVLGIFTAWTNARVYYATYPVRKLDCTNGCHELSPLHFPFIQQEVQDVLALKGKSFGGILHTHWPFFNFLTASLNRHVAMWNEQPQYFTGSLNRTPGSCVFWSETERERERMVGFTRDKTFTDLKKERLAIYESLVASPIKECGPERGQGYWRNVLCWECR